MEIGLKNLLEDGVVPANDQGRLLLPLVWFLTELTIPAAFLMLCRASPIPKFVLSPKDIKLPFLSKDCDLP